MAVAIIMELLRKTNKILNQNTQSPSSDLSLILPKYRRRTQPPTPLCLFLYRVIKTSLCTWWLYCNRQVHRDFLIILSMYKFAEFLTLFYAKM